MAHNIFTVSLDDEVDLRLEQLAQTTQRSKALLVQEAVKAYLGHEDWQLAEIQAALAEAEAGDFASAEDLAALSRKWPVAAR